MKRLWSRIPAAARLLLAAAVLGSGCSNASAPPAVSAEPWTTVFGNEDWYRQRREPEREFTGVLERRESASGPGARLGLLYALRSEARELPIYAAGVESLFEPWIGRTVGVRGKLVESSAAGASGQELWVGRLTVLQKPKN